MCLDVNKSYNISGNVLQKGVTRGRNLTVTLTAYNIYAGPPKQGFSCPGL